MSKHGGNNKPQQGPTRNEIRKRQYAQFSHAQEGPTAPSGDTHPVSGESLKDYLAGVRPRGVHHSHSFTNSPRTSGDSSPAPRGDLFEIIEGQTHYKSLGLRILKQSLDEVRGLDKNQATSTALELRDERKSGHFLVPLGKNKFYVSVIFDSDGRREVTIPEVKPETLGAKKDPTTGKYYAITSNPDDILSFRGSPDDKSQLTQIISHDPNFQKDAKYQDGGFQRKTTQNRTSLKQRLSLGIDRIELRGSCNPLKIEYYWGNGNGAGIRITSNYGSICLERSSEDTPFNLKHRDNAPDIKISESLDWISGDLYLYWQVRGLAEDIARRTGLSFEDRTLMGDTEKIF